MYNSIKIYSILILTAIMLIGCSTNVFDAKESFLKDSEVIEVFGKSVEDWNLKLDEINFTEKYPEYFCEYSNDEAFEGIIIANYDTKKITPVNGIQEVFEYGNLYGDLESEKYVQISILDKYKDYSVNINLNTGELQDEYGEFFLEEDKMNYINNKIDIIKEIIE